MNRYLFSPAFEFTANLVDWFALNHPLTGREGAPRVLVYPIEDGLRMRTLAFDRSLTLNVTGSLVKIEFSIDGVSIMDRDVLIEATKVDDIGVVITRFFNEAKVA